MSAHMQTLALVPPLSQREILGAGVCKATLKHIPYNHWRVEVEIQLDLLSICPKKWMVKKKWRVKYGPIFWITYYFQTDPYWSSWGREMYLIVTGNNNKLNTNLCFFIWCCKVASYLLFNWLGMDNEHNT